MGDSTAIFDNSAVSTSGEGAGGGASLRIEAADLNQGDSIRMEFTQNDVSGKCVAGVSYVQEAFAFLPDVHRSVAGRAGARLRNGRA